MAFIPGGLLERINEICGEGLPLKFDISPEGGYCVSMTNKTGGNSIKGTIVEPSSGTDSAFETCTADGYDPIGIVYTDGIADGSECWVVMGGIAQILLKDATASTRKYWTRISADTAGRADATIAAPAGSVVGELDQHMREVGHCIETKGADTNVLALFVLHFL